MARRRENDSELGAKAAGVGSELIPVRLLGLGERGGEEDGVEAASLADEDVVEVILMTGDRIRARGRLADRLCRRVVRLLERDRC